MNSRINNIQILRAFAAISVAFFHTGYVKGHGVGSYGVDVFFVVSGYIMAMVCAKKPDHFLLKRAIRILPLYWTATLAAFAFDQIRPSLVNSINQTTFVELVKSLCFIPYLRANGLPGPVLFQGWTLNYEIYFYVLLSLGIALLGAKWAPLAASGVIIASCCLPLVFARTPIIDFYSSSLPLEFVAGLLCYYISARLSPSLNVVGIVAVTAICIGTLVSVQALDLWNVPRTIRLGIPAFFLVLSASALAKGVDLDFKLAALIGDASYMLYLVHPYVETPATMMLLASGKAPLNPHHSLIGVLILLFLVTFISIAAYTKVERPFTRWLSRCLLISDQRHPVIRPTGEASPVVL